MAGIEWREDGDAKAGRRFAGYAGAVHAGSIEFDGSNRLWLWSSPLVEDIWGWAPTREAAEQAFQEWLRQWLANFAGVIGGPKA